MVEVAIFPTTEMLAIAAAERVVVAAAEAISDRDRFLWSLAGGSTPRRCYEMLASSGFKEKVRWANVHVFWGDERCVEPNLPASNYRMATDALLAHVPIPKSHVHRIRGEDDPETAAQAYDNLLRKELSFRKGFDLALLGLGADGHTASIFPGKSAVHETEKWAIAQTVDLEPPRITVTFPVFNASRSILFLVDGNSKAVAAGATIQGPSDIERWPAQGVLPTEGSLVWLLDERASAQLERDK